MKIFTAIAFLIGTLGAAQAEEVRIGHLETNDDADLNWLQFRCDQTGLAMRCDLFQTLILRKKVTDDARHLAEDGDAALAEFKKSFGDTCPQIVAMQPKMEEALRTGIGVNGAKINKRIAVQGQDLMRQIVQTCRNQTAAQAKAFFAYSLKQDERTCIFHNDVSSETFQWNANAAAWVSQTPPGGACGTIEIGTLKQDPKNHFWNYVEQHIRTNPDGTLPTGQHCKDFPDVKLNYSWRKTSLNEHCDVVESDQY